MQPTRDSEILFGAGRENADPKVHQLRPAPAGPHWADEKRAVQQQQTDAIVAHTKALERVANVLEKIEQKLPNPQSEIDGRTVQPATLDGDWNQALRNAFGALKDSDLSDDDYSV